MPDISMSGISGIGGEIGSPLASSHRFINFISSDCELLMRAPSRAQILVLSMRFDQRSHLNRLRMMHDHALHELHIFR